MGMLCVMYGHNMSKPDYELLLQEAAEQFSLAHPSGIDLLPMYWTGCQGPAAKDRLPRTGCQGPSQLPGSAINFGQSKQDCSSGISVLMVREVHSQGQLAWRLIQGEQGLGIGLSVALFQARSS